MSPVVKARAVIFDLDETLIEEEASNDVAARHACEVAAARRGVDRDAMLAALRMCSRDLWLAGPMIDYCREIGISAREGLWGSFSGPDKTSKSLREWISDYRIEAWAQALRAVGVEDRILAAELTETFARERRVLHVVFPETIEVLYALREKFRLAMITNGAVDIQRAKIAGSGLAPYFDPILISGEVGRGKPEAAIFRLALEQLNVAPQNAVMVGDSLSRDVGGARAVGIQTVWVNRFLRPRDNRYPAPDHEMVDLRALPSMLHRVA